ncbi:MAG: flippase [Caldimonas sp.]
MRFVGEHAGAVDSRMRRLFTGDTHLSAVLGNSAWLMLDRLIRMAISLLVVSWMARHLGPSRYGELAYGLALIALWQVISALGFESVLVRDVARQPLLVHRYLGTALRMRLASGAICWIGAILAAVLLEPSDTSALIIVAVLGASLLFQAADVVDLWFQSQIRSRAAVLPRLLAYLGASAVRVALILSDAPVWAFAFAVVAETALTAIALKLAYRGHRTGQAWTWDRSIAFALLRESWPFILASMSVIVYMRIDQLVLRQLSNAHELGLYSAMLPFSQAWQMIPMAICASVLPRLSVLKETDPARYRYRVLQLFSFMFWAGLGVAAVTAALAPWLVRHLLGAAYADAVVALQWHAFTNVFVFLGVAQSVTIVSDRTSRIALARTLLGAVVSLGLNVLLTPRWGAVGAAWAALAAYMSAAVLSNAVLAPAYLRLQMRAIWPVHAQPG